MTEGDSSIMVVIGTRPEAIKTASVVRALGSRVRLVHTGQHYDAQMWGDVAAELGLPEPHESLTIGGAHRGEQIGLATAALTRHLLAHPADAVIVQGDTNSTVAGALAATATSTFLVHVEAGLRSHDRSMPEEVNRLLVDRVADLCCAPLPANAEQLRREGVGEDAVCVTGNTLADVVKDLLPGADETATVRHGFGVDAGGYVLATLHRPANVDDPARLAALLGALAETARQLPVVFLVHPRTRARIAADGLSRLAGGVCLADPVGPRAFLALQAGAALVVSDSGGVQEEACLLRRPLLVARDSTERPELLDGWCRLLGEEEPGPAMRRAVADAPAWAARLADRPLPYPHTDAGAVIVAELDRRLGDV